MSNAPEREPRSGQGMPWLSGTVGAALILLLIAMIAFFLAWQIGDRERHAEATRRLRRAEERLENIDALTAEIFREQEQERQRRYESLLRQLATDFREAKSRLGRPPIGWQELGRPDGNRDEFWMDVDWKAVSEEAAPERLAGVPFAWEKPAARDGSHWLLFADLKTIRKVTSDELLKLKTPAGK